MWSKKFRNFFNLTSTYRWDSDIVKKFGSFESRTNSSLLPSVPPLSMNMSILTEEVIQLSRKPNLVFWVASNCCSFSHWEKYVTELQKYLEVKHRKNTFYKWKNTCVLSRLIYLERVGIKVTLMKTPIKSTNSTWALKTLFARITSQKRSIDPSQPKFYQ